MRNVIVRPYRKGEEQYVADLHRRLYSTEYSWGPSFTDYAVNIALEFAKKAHNDREELFVAQKDDCLIGCIMLCQTEAPEVGQLRLFAVEMAHRCEGVGAALMDAFWEKAKSAGYEKLMLWTASPLTAAIRHYERLGFRRTDSVENHTWSTEGALVEEIKMERELR